jgi:hypothetical protein
VLREATQRGRGNSFSGGLQRILQSNPRRAAAQHTETACSACSQIACADEAIHGQVHVQLLTVGAS